MTDRPFILTAQTRHQLRKQVMDILRHGRANAMRAAEITRLLHQRDDRLIRVVIRELISEGIPIASSVTEPMGYFIAENDDEAVRYIQGLEARIREDQARLDEFRKAAEARFSLPQQLSMGVTV